MKMQTMKTKPIIGISGGIGAGKSLVAEMLKSLGAAVIDSDSLAHQCLGTLDCRRQIKEWWGESVISSHGLPRNKKIAEIVFADAVELKRLEDLLFPRIKRLQENIIAVHNANESIRAIILDAPTLYEAKADSLCDAVIFVKCDREARVSRIEARGWTEAQLTQREDMQYPLSLKEEKADHVVENNSDLDALQSQVEQAFLVIVK